MAQGGAILLDHTPACISKAWINPDYAHLLTLLLLFFRELARNANIRQNLFEANGLRHGLRAPGLIVCPRPFAKDQRDHLTQLRQEKSFIFCAVRTPASICNLGIRGMQ